ncbi:MAG: T9SS C-terminal target domain-containing protein [Chitinophagia bacterium]|nr:T9SS C-terminal target domain-containing protein [Chitinophagia bacterium]
MLKQSSFMFLKKALFTIITFCCLTATYGQYNQMSVPDTLSGTSFDLSIRDTFRQMIPGNQTITAAINGSWWGPTLIFRKGDVVHPTVHNQMADTTTIHWHGMHLPAIMDGGPHQVINPYSTWSPYWKVDNNAGLYWYHPHLHMEAEKQLTQGIGGLIIVRDSIESSLGLPRTYGVDDVPLVLTDRSFDATNQLTVVPYGDSMLTNGVLRAKYSIPAQVVRLRVLDAAIERAYNLGFSDNRNFYVIATDGGLLDTPVLVNRLLIHAGERYEILVNCTGQSGTTVDLKAYNASLSTTVAGGESFPGGPFANALGHADFNILHLSIGAATSSAITTVPHTLTTNTFYSASSAALTRNLSIIDSSGVPGITGAAAFVLNHKLFDINYVNYSVPLDNTEIWEITSTSNFGHPFHIHDVEFYVLSVNGAAAPAYQQGWKDVIHVPARQTVKFITRFTDYSDSLHPYMFHCHIALHEDEGMMGQFVVGNAPSGIMNVAQNNKLRIYPNPVKGLLRFEVDDLVTLNKALIININGATVKQFDIRNTNDEIDISDLTYGMYFIRLVGNNGKSYIKSFVKE